MRARSNDSVTPIDTCCGCFRTTGPPMPWRDAPAPPHQSDACAASRSPLQAPCPDRLNHHAATLPTVVTNALLSCLLASLVLPRERATPSCPSVCRPIPFPSPLRLPLFLFQFSYRAPPPRCIRLYTHRSRLFFVLLPLSPPCSCPIASRNRPARNARPPFLPSSSTATLKHFFHLSYGTGRPERLAFHAGAPHRPRLRGR